MSMATLGLSHRRTFASVPVDVWYLTPREIAAAYPMQTADTQPILK